MATIEKPSAHTSNEVSSQDAENLIERLDDLLAEYLNTLDQYQKARKELSDHLSSGFISLAQANFGNKGRRYGQDYYDERMQAQRKVTFTQDEKDGHIFNVAEVEPHEADESTANEREDDETEKPKPKSEDALRWFGVLVPQTLRSAQSNFISATEGPIPSLLTLQNQLRNLEIEVGRTRKSIKKLPKV